MLALLVLSAGCASDEEGGDSDRSSSGGGVQSSDESPGGNPDAGVSSGDSGLNIDEDQTPEEPAEDAPVAQDTEQGLLPISSEQAAALEDPEQGCAGWSAEPEDVPSVLQFIVDISGSMLQTTAATNGASKWEITRQALQDAIANLSPRMSVGLTLFPNMALDRELQEPRPASACVNTSDNVQIGELTDEHRSALLAALAGVELTSQGATPTHDAYNIATDELRAANFPGNRYALLITDGQPTQELGCLGSGYTSEPRPTDPIVEGVASALADSGIRTFIVGSPGSEQNVSTGADARGWLSAAARAGGTAIDGCDDSGTPSFCHFDISGATDFGQALAEALNSITHQVVSCAYTVPPMADGQQIDPSLTNLVYGDGQGNSYLILPNTSSSCDRGYHFADASNSEIEICSVSCDLLQANPDARLSVVFGCEAGRIPDVY